MFNKIDINTWDRKELWDNFIEEPVILSITIPINITKLYKIAKRKKIKLSVCIIYAISRVVNKIDNFRVFVNENGEIGFFDVTSPKHTAKKHDTEVFSTIFTEYSNNFLDFYNRYIENNNQYNEFNGKERFTNSNGRKDYFRISYLPSVDFTSLVSLSVANNHAISCRPFFAVGKFTKKINKITVPLSISISHLAVDAFHLTKFINLLQDEIKLLSIEIRNFMA